MPSGAGFFFSEVRRTKERRRANERAFPLVKRECAILLVEILQW